MFVLLFCYCFAPEIVYVATYDGTAAKLIRIEVKFDL